MLLPPDTTASQRVSPLLDASFVRLSRDPLLRLSLPLSPTQGAHEGKLPSPARPFPWDLERFLKT